MTKLKKIITDEDITVSELAETLDVSKVLVWQWVSGQKPVGAKHVMKFCKLLNYKVTPNELRPDIFKREN